MLRALPIQRFGTLQRISTPFIHTKRFEIRPCRFQPLIEPREAVRQKELVCAFSIQSDPATSRVKQILELQNRPLDIHLLPQNAAETGHIRIARGDDHAANAKSC
jgi:hypothetical protein